MIELSCHRAFKGRHLVVVVCSAADMIAPSTFASPAAFGVGRLNSTLRPLTITASLLFPSPRLLFLCIRKTVPYNTYHRTSSARLPVKTVESWLIWSCSPCLSVFSIQVQSQGRSAWRSGCTTTSKYAFSKFDDGDHTLILSTGNKRAYLQIIRKDAEHSQVASASARSGMQWPCHRERFHAIRYMGEQSGTYSGRSSHSPDGGVSAFPAWPQG